MNGFLNILAEHDLAAGAAGTTGSTGASAASAGEIFGELSQRAAENSAAAEAVASGFAQTTPFHAAAVLLLACYLLVLCRYPELPALLREYIFSPMAARDARINDNRNDPLRGFSWGLVLLGALFFCTAVVRLADSAAPTSTASAASAIRLMAVPAAAAAFVLLLAFQRGVLAAAGALTLSQSLTTPLARIKTIYFRLAIVTMTPLLLIWALAPSRSGDIFGAAVALQAILVVAAFLRETFLLFVSKKLSIYHWILYLCAVEAFPVSFACLLAAKG